MKKSILVCAMFSAFTMVGTAQAASVELYGTVDTGMLYTHESVDGDVNGQNVLNEDDDRWGMESGIGTSSVIGVRGTEEITDSLSVSFVLEHSFASDSGASDDDSHFFDKESQVSISGTVGTLSMGRMGALTAGEGTYDLFMLTGDAMDGGYVDYIGAGYWMDRGIYDNTVTYQSPEFAGFTLYAQYSLGVEGDDSVPSRDKTRYGAIGLGYTAGNFSLAVVGDTILKNRNIGDAYRGDAIDDAMAISVGMNYDFGIGKPFIGFQYGKHEETIGGYDFAGDFDLPETVGTYGDFDGYALAIGSAFPVLGGELQVSVYYADGDGTLYGFEGTQSDSVQADVTRYGVGVFHNYELSKRTSLYGAVGYDHQEVDYTYGTDKANVERDGVQVGIGITHNF